MHFSHMFGIACLCVKLQCFTNSHILAKNVKGNFQFQTHEKSQEVSVLDEKRFSNKTRVLLAICYWILMHC